VFDMPDEARLQATAGMALLTNSKLVRWSTAKSWFESVSRKHFEGYSTKSLDPYFGRIMRWILFSAGGELFVKGMCLFHNIEIRSDKPKSVPNYPGNVEEWLPLVQDDPNAAGTFQTTDFGTMNRVLHSRPGGSFLKRLAHAVSEKEAERAQVIAAFGLLTHTIRNRDAHAYVPNVRDGHFRLGECQDFCV
jgi:hypothetical protein